MNHLREYFQEEFSNINEEVDEENKQRIRFMYFLAYLFLFLFICKLLYII